MLNYKYKLKKLTNGKYYIVREMSHKGFKKWQAGKLANNSGIVTIPIVFQLLIALSIITLLLIITAHLGGCDSSNICEL